MTLCLTSTPNPRRKFAKEAKELKKRLDDSGVVAEMVAPRLWFSPMTVDGAYTSNDKKCRHYAIERSLRAIDIGKILGTDLLVLWLAREGTYLREAKNGKRSMELLVEAFDQMLAHDKRVRCPSNRSRMSRWITLTFRRSDMLWPSPS